MTSARIRQLAIAGINKEICYAFYLPYSEQGNNIYGLFDGCNTPSMNTKEALQLNSQCNDVRSIGKE
jgi:hypothetical protein